MAIRIALISANRHCEPYPVYPLGTAYLKSYIKGELGEEAVIDVVDMNLTCDEALRRYLRESNPQYVALSIRNVDGANSLDRRGFLSGYKHIVQIVRESTTAPMIIGGAAFSIFPELFMRELGAEYGLKGEGEEGLCRLIRSLIDGEGVDGVEDLYSAGGGRHTPRCNYISTPRAEYEPQLVEYYWRESGMLNIQTKRGCPYKCIYCTYPEIDGRSVRTVEIDSIIESMKRAKRDHGVNYWFFTDSVFNINPTYNSALAEAIIKNELNISWGAYFTPSNISDEQMALYKRAGLTHIEFGTESLCDDTLALYDKRFTVADALEASQIALRHNVYYSHFMILAGWGDTNKNIETTIKNSKRLRHTVIFPYIGMRVYPHTRLHSYCVASGVLNESDTLLKLRYYISPEFDLESTRKMALGTGKAWIFPDDEPSDMMRMLRVKRGKKGPLWEYLRRP